MFWKWFLTKLKGQIAVVYRKWRFSTMNREDRGLICMWVPGMLELKQDCKQWREHVEDG